MALPKLQDHEAVKAARAARKAADEARDAARLALKQAENELADLQFKIRSNPRADDVVRAEEVEASIPRLIRDRDLAQMRWAEAGTEVTRIEAAARAELKRTRAVTKAIASQRKDLIKAARAFLRAQADAMAIEDAGKAAGLWSYVGEFGDAPPLAIRGGQLEASEVYRLIDSSVTSLERAG